MLDERFQVAAKNGQRRAQLVRNVGHEIAPHHFQPLDPGDVVKDHHRAIGLAAFVADRYRAHFEMPRRLRTGGTLKRDFLAPRLAAFQCLAHDEFDSRLAQRLEHGALHRVLLKVKELDQLAVGQPDDVPGVDHHDALDHVGQKHAEVLLLLLALEIAQ